MLGTVLGPRGTQLFMMFDVVLSGLISIAAGVTHIIIIPIFQMLSCNPFDSYSSL